MSRYKIFELDSGFSIWEMRDFGNGWAYEDTGQKFKTKEDAKDFIEKKKRGESNDSE